MRLQCAPVTDLPWHEWVAAQMRRHGWATQAEVVKATDIDRTLISNWLDPDRYKQPTIPNCRRAAKAFGVPLLNVLVAAGHLTPDEVNMPVLPDARDVVRMSASEVVEELRRKIAVMEAALQRLCAEEQPGRVGITEYDFPANTPERRIGRA